MQITGLLILNSLCILQHWNRSWMAARKKRLSSSQVPKQAVGPTQPVITQSLPGSSGPRVNLATYLTLVPRLRKHGVTFPLRHMTSWRCASLRTGTALFHLHIWRLHRQTEDVTVYLLLLFFLHYRKKALKTELSSEMLVLN